MSCIRCRFPFFILIALRLITVNSFALPKIHCSSADVFPPRILFGKKLSAPLFQSNDKNAFGDRFDNLSSKLSNDLGAAWSFSGLMILCGAALGPFLDSYHSAFGVLHYDAPIELQLWGTSEKPTLITSWWVPELFGLAGFIIGWLYIILDELLPESGSRKEVTGPLILFGISIFTAQYWLSGVLFAMGMDRTLIFNVMSIVAASAFYFLDGTRSGLYTSTATAIGGPLIEVGLISYLSEGGYHYTDSGAFGFFPLWIVPVYFLGGPAVGNLARGFWKVLREDGDNVSDSANKEKEPPGCKVCKDSRCVCCPNCDCEGYYVTYGRSVKCNACKGRGLVICRSCFSYYGEDPSDIQGIRDIMSRFPD
mmetsp:Transcript_6791/g.9914  ORF Transcript_6791/g.9914 Transcript_6791/m.9914 type:complete len:366 (+) Transcript_6791:35-1132(+)